MPLVEIQQSNSVHSDAQFAGHRRPARNDPPMTLSTPNLSVETDNRVGKLAVSAQSTNIILGAVVGVAVIVVCVLLVVIVRLRRRTPPSARHARNKVDLSGLAYAPYTSEADLEPPTLSNDIYQPRASSDYSTGMISRPGSLLGRSIPDSPSTARSPFSATSPTPVVLSPPSSMRVDSLPISSVMRSDPSYQVSKPSFAAEQESLWRSKSSYSSATCDTGRRHKSSTSECSSKVKVDVALHITNRQVSPVQSGRSPIRDAGPVLSPGALSVALPPRYTQVIL